jgi:hypothetical protein
MMEILCSMARIGLVHCDFNEFNALITPDGKLTAIDFPQMVSMNHANARALFDRDLNCIVKFFTHKLNYSVDAAALPAFAELLAEMQPEDAVDAELHASGFNNTDADQADADLLHGNLDAIDRALSERGSDARSLDPPEECGDGLHEEHCQPSSAAALAGQTEAVTVHTGCDDAACRDSLQAGGDGCQSSSGCLPDGSNNGSDSGDGDNADGELGEDGATAAQQDAAQQVISAQPHMLRCCMAGCPHQPKRSCMLQCHLP